VLLKDMNDLCYNPHWPNNPDISYEGKVVSSCDQGGNNCGPERYLVLDGERRFIDEETFTGLWPGPEVVISRPADAFKDLPIAQPLCHNTPIIRAGETKQIYMVVDSRKRLIANAETEAHMQLKANIAQAIP